MGPTNWIYCFNMGYSVQHLCSFCILDAEPVLIDAHGWWVLHAVLSREFTECTWLSQSVTHKQQHWSVMEECGPLCWYSKESQMHTQNLVVNVILRQCLNGD